MVLETGFFGEVSSLIDCMTGTNFAGGINKSLSKWADRDKNPEGNDWVDTERPVRIVRSKPKAIESSFTKTTTVATPKSKNKVCSMLIRLAHKLLLNVLEVLSDTLAQTERLLSSNGKEPELRIIKST